MKKLFAQRKTNALLSLGALGIVFGDIGTSPLYCFSVIFGNGGDNIAANKTNIYGVISLVIWSILLVVTIKFIAFIMRAGNAGEGGIMALLAQIRNGKVRSRYSKILLLIGLIGVGLFYGDSVITPAVSVLSAVEGLKVVAPHAALIVVPLTLLIITALFTIQHFGTSVVGRLFGPIMLVWFTAIGTCGLWRVWQQPSVLTTLSPTTAISFFIYHPLLAFIAMGAVVLAITGAEALYADMGHFGRTPIAKAWYFIVFPSLILCYMGEGALLVGDPSVAANPLVLMFPATLRIPFVILATFATVVASQSVISGAFSLTKQAVQLNYLPKMLIKHTSAKLGGQVYLPFVNAGLFIIVSLLVILFGSSAKLANAYGLSVSGTLAADSILFLAIVGYIWHKPKRYIFAIALLFMPIDILFITSSSAKVLHGGWFPIVIGSLILCIITTWRKGEQITTVERKSIEGLLRNFIGKIHSQQPPIGRIPGTAIYIGHHAKFTPLALHAAVAESHELHEKVVIVSVQVSEAAHIPLEKRAVYDELDYLDGIAHVSLTFGFHDVLDVPAALQSIRYISPELDFDVDTAAYFVSMARVVQSKRHNMPNWRKSLYCTMARNAFNTTDYYKLPRRRTTEMASILEL
ncbi:KUP/HAK/KT family potassium transporter [Candidatus Saccharibacteria bacterium]|nr:KUP/HAK/KT family potassium transporter [Candidatus Saccharibacteria bacterium]